MLKSAPLASRAARGFHPTPSSRATTLALSRSVGNGEWALKAFCAICADRRETGRRGLCFDAYKKSRPMGSGILGLAETFQTCLGFSKHGGHVAFHIRPVGGAGRVDG